MPKKENVRKMFDSIAPEYDKLNHILSLDIDRRWRKAAVKEIVDTGSRLAVLDVACGTADFSIAIARKISGGSLVTGVDLSEKMLAIGRKKIVEEGLTDKIVIEPGDCERLRFPDENFDRVAVAFGVRNFEHLDTALGEMCRVLRPGGHLVILELSEPEHFPMKQGYAVYSKVVIPALGRLLSKDRSAYTYLPESIKAFPQGEIMQEIIRKAGFSQVEFKRLTMGTCTLYFATK